MDVSRSGQQDGAPPRSLAHPHTHPDTPPAPGASDPVTILVVEDDASLAEMLAIHLSLDGFRVASVHNGIAALRLAASLHPEVVLLDVNMTGMDGLEVCRALRITLQERQPSIIMLSGETSDIARDRCVDAGADAFLGKPFDPEDLSTQIQVLLAEARDLRTLDPRTGLPGHAWIAWEAARRARGGEAITVIEIDLEGIDTFADRYGERRRDQAVRLAARILGAVAETRPPTLVGHRDETSFVLVTPTEGAADLCALALDTFEACIAGVYDRAHAGDGGPDRSARAPLSMSIGSLSGGAPAADTVTHLRSAASRRARAATGGARVIDGTSPPVRTGSLRDIARPRRSEGRLL